MAIPTRIYLTGFMGSGKSTIGPLIAERLGYEFIDLDEAIEQIAGKSVQSIFSSEGEDAFRRLEALKLRSVSRTARAVISLGGGAVASEDNLYFAKTNGLLVYLRVSGEDLAERLQESAGERPLLQDSDGRPLTGPDLVARIEEMMAKRTGYYEQADIMLDIDRHGIDEVVDMAVHALHTYREGSR
ncbi:MAG: shikimate kinase [Rhodothermales bacterium]